MHLTLNGKKKGGMALSILSVQSSLSILAYLAIYQNETNQRYKQTGKTTNNFLKPPIVNQ